MPRIKVEVTKECIKNGVPGIKRCPIALALKQYGHHGVWVGKISCGWNKTRTSKIIYVLPERAMDFIDAFDAGKRPEPFSFWLTVEK